MHWRFRFLFLLPFLCTAAALALGAEESPKQNAPGSNRLPSFEEAMTAKHDVWGEAAMAQPNGPSYDFFASLLPPPRYVNADFHFYPIVLSAPNSTVKARLISNGSGVNLRGGTRSWHDVGPGVVFRVGPDELRFGEFLDRLQHPTLAEGFLPIAQIQYDHEQQGVACGYQLEAFASVAPELAEHAVVFVKFSCTTNNLITAQPEERATFSAGALLDEKQQPFAFFDKNWSWERGSAHAQIGPNRFATLAVLTKPLGEGRAAPSDWFNYEAQRKLCAETWEKLLQQGMQVEVPEPCVNNAWRNLLIQNFELMKGHRMHYSSGNQYDALYEAEGSDAALSMLDWGFEEEVRKLLPPLLDFTRKGLEFHQAGHKLDDLSHYYWQTRDAEFISAMRTRWEKELQRIFMSRTNEYGLFPKEQYCGDIATPVYSLNSNAKCWAALRDFGPVLDEIGDHQMARRVNLAAAEFKQRILAALDKSIRHDTDPPFVPIALFGEEEPHDPITHSRIGGYWDLMANYLIGARILTGDREAWLAEYLEKHGGLCMGMTRSGAVSHTFWTGVPRTNPLYGLRYVSDVLRRDEPERALVNFYGMLAQGFTRNTFIGAEGCSLTPLDHGGRIFFCPPNSASNAEWLTVLRNLLVQDLDLDDDGRPETLRLMFATPRLWLADGNKINIQRAPTAFGPVSIKMESHLAHGEIVADVALPVRNPAKKTLLRARLPEGWRVTASLVTVSEKSTDNPSKPLKGQTVPVEKEGTVDLSGFKGGVRVQFSVARK